MSEILERLSAALGGHYRIARELGRGGMATVFLARDLRHDRNVALKVLHPELAAVVGTDRFLSEIRVTAGLQHPHILPLFDSGEAAGLVYYVMPHVEGQTLRDRLEREKQLPVDEVIAITRAVASALDYAHRQGVIHRDIKPENILLQDGQPLVADFGIALALSASGGARLTETGLSLGTPRYMSPEQLTGERELDARSDIYALSCVAYEMLAGETPFTGPTSQAVITAAMTQDAAPVTKHRRRTPEALASAIHRGLERVPSDRFPSAAEFATALTTGPQTPVGRRAARRRTTVGVVAGVVGGLVVGGVLAPMLSRDAGPAVRRWNLALPATAPLALAGPASASGWYNSIALSPAGDHLAYIAPRGTTTVLAVRRLDADSETVLPGTDGAYAPFYSPDGSWIGFFSGNLLRKIAAAGGAPVTVAQADHVTGAAWASTDRIMVMENQGFDLHWVSATGATTDSIVHLTTQFGTPSILPGAQWAVGQLSSGQLAMLSLADGRETAITQRGVLPMDSVRQGDLLFGASPRWIAPGYLLYGAGDGLLMAMPFDAAGRRVRGGSVPLFSGMRMEAGFGSADFTIADDGTLLYVPGGNQLYSSIALVTPAGRIDTLPIPRGPYTQPRISPDGKRLAVQQRDPVGGWEVLLIDLTTGARQRVDVQGNYRAFPASWLPDGRELMIGLFDPVQFLNYGARIQSLVTGTWTDLHLNGASYMTVAPDGQSFVFSDWRNGDLFLRRLNGDTTRQRIPARGTTASFSPDGRWVAWGGVDGTVSVSPVPPTGQVTQVVERGEQPLWTPKGDALVYRDGDRYYRVPVSTAGGFHAGHPQLFTRGSFVSTFAWNHAMSPDGRLLVLLNRPEREMQALDVITGVPALVKRYVHTGK